MTALEILGRRWSVAIIELLAISPLRFADLRRRLPAITPKVLFQHLSFMADAGVVMRLAPRRGGVYTLTPSGRSLLPIIAKLKSWAPTDATALL